jgi:geranylgeranyl pyrophosphate synthase
MKARIGARAARALTRGTPRLLRRADTDPFKLVEPDLRPLSDSIKDLVGVDHPVLNKVARHFFDMQGKRFRPTILLLVSQAVGSARDSPVFAQQKRLAEITEMIHTASLIHDDVIDVSDMRRGSRTVHKIFGNKVAVLAGDFLLARSSVLLARLSNVKVVELMATVLEDMVHGEMMQARAEPDDLLTFDHYILKNYLKTGSLISLSCQSAAVLGGAAHDTPVALAARDYGRHLGVAYQLIDDLLDYTASEAQLGKPALADMASGLATAPALFAARQFPEMRGMIKRGFSQEADLEVCAAPAACASPAAPTRPAALRPCRRPP